MKKISFFQKVYKVVKKIPYGKVTTYGAIAKYLGTPSSSRTVGWATHWCEMMSNPKQKIGRPRQLYLGEKKRDYVPINDR